MTVAWWPHTTSASVASYRLRCLQIIEALCACGVDASLYRKGMHPTVLVLSKRYDASSLQQALSLRELHGTRLVLDLCDNHFYSNTAEPAWLARAETLRKAVKTVDMVVCASDYLEKIVQQEADQPVLTMVIGDAAEPPFFPQSVQRLMHPPAEICLMRLNARLNDSQVSHGRRLVWFGNHGSGYADGGMNDLHKLHGPLERAHQEGPISVTVISNHAAKYRALTRRWSFPHHYLGWHLSTISRALQLHSVALIPIQPNPFTLCKTSNRLITATLHGLAVAADDLPSYHDFADCTVLDDWDEGLRKLLADVNLRRTHVERASEKIQSHWTLDRITEQWLTAFRLVTQQKL